MNVAPRWLLRPTDEAGMACRSWARLRPREEGRLREESGCRGIGSPYLL
jgi:hypothetical protein